MKLDSQKFKRFQRIVNELCSIGLPEDELKEITVAGIEAYYHRKSGTTFTEAQLEYRCKKNKTKNKTTETPAVDLVDEIFMQMALEQTNLLTKGKEILGKTKLWFEKVPDEIKKGLDK